MARIVKCMKLGRELEGLDRPPWPGELGRRIYENISKEAWRGWLEESTKLLNETRLDVTSEAGQKFYAAAMEDWFFGSGTPLEPDPGRGGNPS